MLSAFWGNFSKSCSSRKKRNQNRWKSIAFSLPLSLSLSLSFSVHCLSICLYLCLSLSLSLLYCSVLYTQKPYTHNGHLTNTSLPTSCFKLSVLWTGFFLKNNQLLLILLSLSLSHFRLPLFLTFLFPVSKIFGSRPRPCNNPRYGSQHCSILCTNSTSRNLCSWLSQISLSQSSSHQEKVSENNTNRQTPTQLQTALHNRILSFSPSVMLQLDSVHGSLCLLHSLSYKSILLYSLVVRTCKIQLTTTTTTHSRQLSPIDLTEFLQCSHVFWFSIPQTDLLILSSQFNSLIRFFVISTSQQVNS